MVIKVYFYIKEILFFILFLSFNPKFCNLNICLDKALRVLTCTIWLSQQVHNCRLTILILIIYNAKLKLIKLVTNKKDEVMSENACIILSCSVCKFVLRLQLYSIQYSTEWLMSKFSLLFSNYSGPTTSSETATEPGNVQINLLTLTCKINCIKMCICLKNIIPANFS